MKILVRGDLHLDLVSDGEPRLEEQARIITHTIEVLESVKPDVFVDLGDLFDRTRPSPAAYAQALSYAGAVALWEKETHEGPVERIRTYVIAGNHEKPSRGEISALHPLERLSTWGYGFARVVLMPTLVDFNDGSPALLFLPYVTDWEAKRWSPSADSAQELLDREANFAISNVERLVVFTHLEVPGSRIADDDRTQRDVGTSIPRALLESEKVVRIYAGHVHKYQELKKVTVVGSALHVDFGEAADPKGLIVAEV